MKSLCASLFLCSVSLAQVSEGNLTCAPGGVLPICYGESATCALSSPSEIDVYRFVGAQNHNVRVTLGGSSINLDPRFEILDPQGTLLLESSCNTTLNGVCSTSQDFQLPSSGDYTILVSDAGQNESGNYALDVQLLPPEIPDRFASYGIPEAINIGTRADHDFIAIEGRQNDLVRVSVSGTTINLDGEYTLYAPDGSVLDTDFCTTTLNGICSVMSPNLSLPADGTYHLMLNDHGWDETGNLSVTITCLLGTCPENWIPIGANYCPTNPNSSGNPAAMLAWGSEDVASSTLYLYATDAPRNVFGIFFMGQNQTSAPLFSGVRCIGNPAFRFPIVNSCNRGELRFSPDFDGLPQNVQFLPGQTWNFQAWFRDGSTANTTDGISITFQ